MNQARDGVSLAALSDTGQMFLRWARGQLVQERPTSIGGVAAPYTDASFENIEKLYENRADND